MMGLFSTVPGCTWLYPAVPDSALVSHGLTWSVSDHDREVLNAQFKSKPSGTGWIGNL